METRVLAEAAPSWTQSSSIPAAVKVGGRWWRQPWRAEAMSNFGKKEERGVKQVAATDHVGAMLCATRPVRGIEDLDGATSVKPERFWTTKDLDNQPTARFSFNCQHLEESTL